MTLKARRPFDTTALVYFEAAARLGSLSRAAVELRIAISALSRRVRQLEDDLGVPLFERLPRGLKLTSAGEVLLHHAKQGFHEFKRARDVIEDMRGLRRGQVALATVESVARGPLVSVLTRFWESHPAVGVDVAVVGSAEAVKQVRLGEADLCLAFAVERRPPGLEAIAQATFRIGAVMSPTHELAGSKALTIRGLSAHPVLLADASLVLHQQFQMAADLEPFQPPARLSTNSIALMSRLAAAGSGIAFKTRLGVQDEIQRGELVFVPLKERGLPVQRVVLWARRRQQLTRAAQGLAAVLGAALQAMSEE